MDGSAGSSQKIYFSAGPNGEMNGLFGVLQSVSSVPEPSSLSLELGRGGVARWAVGVEEPPAHN
jgi:hypothetical protein